MKVSFVASDKGLQEQEVLQLHRQLPSQSGALHSRRSRPTLPISLRCHQRGQLQRAMKQLPPQDLPAGDGQTSISLLFSAPRIFLLTCSQHSNSRLVPCHAHALLRHLTAKDLQVCIRPNHMLNHVAGRRTSGSQRRRGMR